MSAIEELKFRVFELERALSAQILEMEGISKRVRALAEVAPTEKTFTRKEVEKLILRALLSWNDNSIDLTAGGTIDAVLKEAGR